MIASITQRVSEHHVARAAQGGWASLAAFRFAASSATRCDKTRDCAHGTFQHPAARAAAWRHGWFSAGTTRCPSQAMAAAMV